MSPLAVIHRTQTRSTAAAHGVCPSAMAPARGVVASSPATSGLSQHTCTDLLVTSPMRKLVGFAGVSSVVTRAPSPAGGLWPTELMACMSCRRPHTRAHRHRHTDTEHRTQTQPHTHTHTHTHTRTATATQPQTQPQPHSHTHTRTVCHHWAGNTANPRCRRTANRTSDSTVPGVSAQDAGMPPPPPMTKDVA